MCSPDPNAFDIQTHIDGAYTDRVRPDLLLQAAQATLAQQQAPTPAALSIVITGDGTVRRLNRTYRGVDAPTDVLAFGSADDPFAGPYLGDVIISFPQAARQAQSAGHPVEAELQLLVVHGVLHLLGHDHAEPDERAAMWTAQAAVLRALGTPVTNPTPE